MSEPDSASESVEHVPQEQEKWTPENLCEKVRLNSVTNLSSFAKQELCHAINASIERLSVERNELFGLLKVLGVPTRGNWYDAAEVEAWRKSRLSGKPEQTLGEPGDVSGPRDVQGQTALLDACHEAAVLLFPTQVHPRIPLKATQQNAAEVIRQTVTSFVQPVIDFAEWGWTIIANAGGGDWGKESKDWQEAAARYRDELHQRIRDYAPSVGDGEKKD